MKTSRQSEAAAERSASPSAAYMMQQDPDSPDIIEFVHRDLARARRIFFSMLFRLRRQCLPLNMCRCEARSATRSAELGNLGNRKLSIIVPKIFSNRRGLKTVKPRGNTINCQAKPEEGWADVRKARQSVMVAVISIAAAFGLPLQAEAKRPEPPPPPPTAYDVRSALDLQRTHARSQVHTYFVKSTDYGCLLFSTRPSCPAGPAKDHLRPLWEHWLAAGKLQENSHGSCHRWAPAFTVFWKIVVNLNRCILMGSFFLLWKACWTLQALWRPCNPLCQLPNCLLLRRQSPHQKIHLRRQQMSPPRPMQQCKKSRRVQTKL